MEDLATQAWTHDVLDGLTQPQQQAVEHVDGPLLVLAGPGSGKTRVITRRIAHLVRVVGIAPWNVLAITFTNKAATEMRQRVGTLVTQRQAKAVTVSTFHSLCARLLRQYGERVGLPPGYSIYDTADQTRAVKQAIEQLQIHTSNFPPARVLSGISKAKNQLMDPKGYADQAGDFYSRTVSGIYTKYQQILTKNNAVDFDDLLLKTVDLCRKCPDVLGELRGRFQYILIDEYQDTNHAQFALAHALAAEHRNLCVTGDPDQSIYRWRGADIHNILEFETHYPNATTVRLEQNYRSTKTIVAAADGLIKQNTQRKHKSLWTENEQGGPVEAITCYDERHEAGWLVEWLTTLNGQHGVAWGDAAVFYRINSLSRVVEDALRKANIPYQIARGTAFYDRQEIKDALAYLRVILNPADEISLVRIINQPARGISANTVKALQAEAVAAGLGVDAMLEAADRVAGLNTRAVNAVKKFAWQLQSWRELAPPPETPGEQTQVDLGLEQASGADHPVAVFGGSLTGFVERVLLESGLQGFYGNDKTDPDEERLMNLGELVSSAQQFEEELELQDEDSVNWPVTRKLELYLERVSLVSDVDAVESTQGAVTLMTLHAAKGLEFPAVAIVGVEEGLLPHSRAQHDDHELEEERRLCFVGITRAESRLAMTSVRYRTVFGQLTPAIPSRFFKELPNDVIEHTDLTQQDEPDDHFTIEDEEDEEFRTPRGLAPGARVRHPHFGMGRIVTLTKAGPQSRAQVRFDTAGVKTLILEYARLELT